MKRIVAFVLVLSIMQSVNAQSHLSSKDELAKHSENVMVFLEGGEFQKAFAELERYWPFPENEMLQLETQTIKQFNVVSERFGTIVGTDFIRDNAIKDYALRKTYVIRFEKHMIRVLFTYYKTENGWILNGFKWDDQIEELFD